MLFWVSFMTRPTRPNDPSTRALDRSKISTRPGQNKKLNSMLTTSSGVWRGVAYISGCCKFTYMIQNFVLTISSNNLRRWRASTVVPARSGIQSSHSCQWLCRCQKRSCLIVFCESLSLSHDAIWGICWLLKQLIWRQKHEAMNTWNLISQG